MMKIFVARQPIFDKKENVVAYELLFRSGNSPVYDGEDDDTSTASVISGAFLLLGMDKATGKKPAFVNFTRNSLKKLARQIPPHSIVLEILETVEPDEELLNLCRQLKRCGYTLALDDFIFDEKYCDLLTLADIIKVDFILTTGKERSEIIRRVNNPRVKFLAEKVETRAEFEEAVALGYTYFQGYFFSKPEVLSGEDVPSYKTQYMRILHELGRPDMDFQRMEQIIKHDVAFSFKLLKYINSSYFGFKKTVDSVRQALVLLGAQQIRQWLFLLILRELGKDRPEEIMVLSVIRAKFGENLARKANLPPDMVSYAFTMGMFSLLDCFFQRPLDEVLSELPINEEIKLALAGSDHSLGIIFRLIGAYEKGEWEAVSACATRLHINELEIPDLYLQTLQWIETYFEQTRW